MADEILRPNGVGALTQCSIDGSSPAPTNWQSVDEAVADDDTTNVYHLDPYGGSLAQDSYQHDSFVASYSTITGVTVYSRGKAVIALYPYGSTGERVFLRIGGVNYYGASHGFTAGVWNTYSDVWATNPAGGAWTSAAINSMEIGIELTAIGHSTYGPATAYCTQLYAQVSYTPGCIGFHTGTNQRRYKTTTYSTFTFPDPFVGTGFTSATDGYWILAGWGSRGLFHMVLSGTLNLAGSLGRKIFVSLGGTITPEGTLAPALRFIKGLSGTLRSSGGLVGKRLVSLGGVLNLSGSLGRFIKVSLGGILNLSGNTQSRLKIFKTLAGTLNLSGIVSTLYRYSKVLAGTLNMSGSLGRVIKVKIGGTLNSAGTLGRKIKITLGGTLNMSGILSKAIPIFKKALAGTLNMSGSLNRKIKVSLGGTLSFIGSLIKKWRGMFSHISIYTRPSHDMSVMTRKASLMILTFPKSDVKIYFGDE
jgi:hypothetical protein